MRILALCPLWSVTAIAPIRLLALYPQGADAMYKRSLGFGRHLKRPREKRPTDLLANSRKLTALVLQFAQWSMRLEGDGNEMAFS